MYVMLHCTDSKAKRGRVLQKFTDLTLKCFLEYLMSVSMTFEKYLQPLLV